MIWLLVVAFAAFGFAFGFIDVGTNRLIVWVFRSDVPPYMNALHLSFAVGAGLGSMTLPWVVDRAFDARGPEMLISRVGITVADAIVMLGIIDVLSNRRGYGSTGR